MDYLKEKIDLKDKRHLLAIIGTIVIFLAIPFTVILVRESREPVSRAETIPNDSGYPSQWYLPWIHAPQAWDITKGSASIKVAIVDTGIASNPGGTGEFSGQLGPGYNAITPGGSTEDDYGSVGGTLHAGIIGARTNNLGGIAGVAWYITM